MRPAARCLFVILLGAIFACASPRRSEDQPSPEEAEGFALLDARRNDLALEKFRESIRANHGTFLAFVGMALAHVRSGECAMFESFAIEASRLAPPNESAFDRLGTMYVSAAETVRGRPQSVSYARLGVDFLRRVFAAEPHRPELPYHLGLGLDLSGDSVGAIVFLEQAHAAEPARDDVLFALLRSLKSERRRARVRDLLDERAGRGPLGKEWSVFFDWLAATDPASRPAVP